MMAEFVCSRSIIRNLRCVDTMFPRAQLIWGPNGIQTVTRTRRNKPHDPQAQITIWSQIDRPFLSAGGLSIVLIDANADSGIVVASARFKQQAKDCRATRLFRRNLKRVACEGLRCSKGSWGHDERHAEPAGSSNSVRYEGGGPKTRLE
jgi:hypothetical protein